MLQVSSNWVAANLKQFRYPASLHATIKVTPPGLTEGLTVTTNDTESVATLDSLFQELPETPTLDYATLEHNRWSLDGSFKLLKNVTDKVTPYWWSTTTNKEKNKIIHFEFDKAYSIPGVFILWDTKLGTYPKAISLEGYDISGKLIQTVNVTNIASQETTVNSAFDGVKTIILNIIEWQPLRWRARINEIVFGVYERYQENTRILRASTLSTVELNGDKLPVHYFNLWLKNFDKYFDPKLELGTAKYLAKQQRIQYEWGFEVLPGVIEWAPKQNSYISEITIPPDSQEVLITGDSRLSQLTKTFIYDNYSIGATKRSLRQVAELILQNSNILKDRPTEVPWKLDDFLNFSFTNAPIPRMAANTLLNLIAQASNGILYSEPIKGYITIEPFEKNKPATHTVNIYQETTDPSMELLNELKAIYLGVNSYSLSSEITEIFKGIYDLKSAQEIQMDYQVNYATNVVSEITNGVILEAEYFSTSAVLKIQAIDINSAVQVILKGNEIKRSISYIKTFEDTIVTSGLEITVNNPFITSTDNFDVLTQTLLERFSIRQKFGIGYKGFVEITPGDKINWESVYNSETTAIVTSNQIDYNGGWSGVVKVW